MRCSHLTCVFFFLTFPFFVSLKYLSLLVLHSNKSCVSREGNANTDGRIRVGVARFVGVLLFLATTGILLKTNKIPNVDETLATSDRLSGLISITVSWLQILSSLTVTYKMAWPPVFASYSQGTGTVANLEFMTLLSFSNCQLAVSFINKFCVSWKVAFLT